MGRYIDGDVLKAEIAQALENNFNVKNDRIKSLSNRGITYNDEFVNVVNGKISALQGINDFIDKQPTADVVEVVRCKDCEYWQDNNAGYPHKECRWNKNETPNTDDYCSFGERRDDKQ